VEVLAAVDRTGEAARAAGPLPARAPAAPSDPLRDDVAELRRLLIRRDGAGLLPPALAALWERLVAVGVEESLAFRLLAELPAALQDGPVPTPEALSGALVSALGRFVSFADPAPWPRTGLVAFVGPAGAGKTTTLAKVAAQSQLAGGRTEILDLDGTGLCGRGPLEALAGILRIPYSLTLTVEEVRAAAQRAPVPGLRLLDTPGVAPRDAASLAPLADLLRAAQPAEVHLVLPATSKTADALAAIRAFAPLGATHLAITRLDESVSPGSVLAIAAGGGLPLSYLATGRDVPSDLLAASAGEIGRRVFGGSCA
jgi:flagellar biosynthesis protein FlhF